MVSARGCTLNSNHPNQQRFQQLFTSSTPTFGRPSNSFYFFFVDLFKGHFTAFTPAKIYYYCFITPQFIYYL